MPWDIVRLPCGSMSTHSTRCPRSANATARLRVVVVLATPPFWLAKTITFAFVCCTLSTGWLRLVGGTRTPRLSPWCLSLLPITSGRNERSDALGRPRDLPSRARSDERALADRGRREARD